MTISVAAGFPITRCFDLAGLPLGGGLLNTYQAGSTTPQPTYQDQASTLPNTNPIVLDSTGSAIVRYTAGVGYKLVLTDSTGATVLATLDNFYAPLTDAATINALLNPRTAAEITAGVTPVNLGYPEGDVRRWAPALDGLADDTTALTNWAKVPGHHTFPVVQTALITAAIPLVSNSTYEFTEGATIQTATHDINMFSAVSKSGITVRGGHFKQTSVGAAANVGGVALSSCSDCVVEDCEFEGMQFSGIFGSAITRCTFRANYIHDALGTGQSSGDIYVESSATVTSSYNVIDGNFCYGATLEFGIAVWDPYTGVLPIHNLVCNNHIKAHNGYGILIYMPDAGDSYNRVIGNHIQDISAHSTNTSSGAGIYVVGAGAGGTEIIGNTIQNCCITTTVASLAPGGIGINSTSAGTVPLVINGNTIEGMTQYHGIILTGVLGGASVTGNTVRHPTQTGTVGDPIQIVNCNNVTVQGNTVTNLSTTTTANGILLYANTAACTNVAVVGNTIKGGHVSQIRCAQVGGFQVQNLVISGNLCSGGDNSCVPLLFDSAAAINVMVTGNILRGGNATTISQIACTNVRYSNNYVNGTGTAMLTTSGACTGSSYDLSNLGAGIGAGVVNGATGFIIEQLGTGAPVAGTWGVGDMVRNSAPSAAGILFWVTTTAGAGTWKTVSNT